MRGFTVAHFAPTVPEREVVPHTHEEAHAVLVLDGAYLTAASKDPCGAPCLVYNPPGTTHRDRFVSLGGRFVTLSISRRALERVAEWTELPERPVLAAAPVVALARRLSREIAAADASAPIVEGLATELLARFGTSRPVERGAPPGWLRRAKELLRDACGDDLSLGEIAAVAGVHPVHLTRAFRRHFRCAPGDYLRRCRLERAAALLVETRAPLAEIADRSGFADQSHLSRRFKRAFGETPRAYRALRRAAAPVFVPFKTDETSKS